MWSLIPMKRFQSLPLSSIVILAFSIGLDSRAESTPIRSLELGAQSYVCNAGIKHEANSQELCFDEKRQSCLQGEENCVCAPTNPSSSLIGATYKAGSDNSSAPSKTIAAMASGKKDYSLLFKENKDSWKHQIETLKIDLGSSNLASKFFIDVCYLGPEYVPSNPEKPQEGYDLSEGFYSFNLLSFVEALSSESNERSYLEISNLKVSLEIVCDLRSIGRDKNARKKNEIPKDLEEDFYQDFPLLPQLSSGVQFEGVINQHLVTSRAFVRLDTSTKKTAQSSYVNGLNHLAISVLI